MAVCSIPTVLGLTQTSTAPSPPSCQRTAGLRLFIQEEVRSLNVMRSLSEENQMRAQLCQGMDVDHGLSSDRWNPFDERHLGGAHQDNHIVPFEGCPISSLTGEQKDGVDLILRAFIIYLPPGPLERRMAELKRFEEQTYFAWIGKFGLGDPYYFRIHSPATFSEFDFHCGIFLTNTSPAKGHIHTVNRMPNCGDYAKALIRSARSA